MKKTSLKRKSRTPEAKLKSHLWELCRLITRKRYGDTCFTCGRKDLVGSNLHCGHFIPSAAGGAFLRYNLQNLRIQCYHCNVNLGGNGAQYYRRLVEEEGQLYVDNLFQLKNTMIIKADRIWLEGMINLYNGILNTEK